MTANLRPSTPRCTKFPSQEAPPVSYAAHPTRELARNVASAFRIPLGISQAAITASQTRPAVLPNTGEFVSAPIGAAASAIRRRPWKDFGIMTLMWRNLLWIAGCAMMLGLMALAWRGGAYDYTYRSVHQPRWQSILAAVLGIGVLLLAAAAEVYDED